MRGEYHNSDVAKYYGQRDNQISGISANISGATNSIAANTMALNQNTAALRGEKINTTISNGQQKKVTDLSYSEFTAIQNFKPINNKLNYIGTRPWHATKDNNPKNPTTGLVQIPDNERTVKMEPVLSKQYNSGQYHDLKSRQYPYLIQTPKGEINTSLLKAKAATGLASGVMASLTARKTVEVDGETYEMSTGAKAVSKTLSGVATGVGSLINPAVGMIFGAFADLITGPIAKAIDGTRIAAEQYRKELERSISVIQKVNSSFATLTKISASKLSRPEDLREMEEALAEIRRTYGAEENEALKELLIANFNKITGKQEKNLAALLNISNLTADEQEDRFYQLALAQKMTENDEQMSQLNSQYADLQKEANEVSRNARGIGEGEGTEAAIARGAMVGVASTTIGAIVGSILLPGLGTIGGAIVGAIAGAGAGVAGAIDSAEAAYNETIERIASEEFGKQGITGQINDLQQLLDEDAERSEDERLLSEEQREVAEKSLNQLKSIRQEMKSNQEQQDALKVQEAMLSGTINGQYLGQLSARQKSLYGVDELYRAIADQLVASGGLSAGEVYNNAATKELSAYGKRIIRTQLMKDEEYAKILKGELYTLEDIYNLPTTGSDSTRTGAGLEKQAELMKKYGVTNISDLVSKASGYYSNAQILDQRNNTVSAKTNLVSNANNILRKYGLTYDELETAGNNVWTLQAKAEVQDYLDKLEELDSKVNLANSESLDTGGYTLKELTDDMTAINELVTENIFNQELRNNAMQAVGATNEQEFEEIVKKHNIKKEEYVVL